MEQLKHQWNLITMIYNLLTEHYAKRVRAHICSYLLFWKLSLIMLWLYLPSYNIPFHWSNHSDEMIRCCESEVFSLSFHRHHLHSPTSELSLRNWYKISAQGCTRKYIFGRYQIQIISVGLIISSIVKSKPKTFWGHALPALQSIIHNMDYNNIIDDSNSHIKRRKNLVSFVNLDA